MAETIWADPQPSRQKPSQQKPSRTSSTQQDFKIEVAKKSVPIIKNTCGSIDTGNSLQSDSEDDYAIFGNKGQGRNLWQELEQRRQLSPSQPTANTKVCLFSQPTGSTDQPKTVKDYCSQSRCRWDAIDNKG